MDEKKTADEARRRQGPPGPGGSGNYHTVVLALLAVIVVATAFNQLQIMSLYSVPLAKAAIVPQQPAASGGAATLAPLDMRPSGVPAIYGSELGIRYDDVSGSTPDLADRTISKLAAYDDGIALEGAELERYVKISSSIACEYCCGAKTLVFSNGQAACGCAHSFAMRGLAKYLIRNHGSEYTDEQILEEMGKWKVLFFPGVHAQKAAILKQQGIELNYVNLASNLYRGIEKGAAAGGSMVGGC
ncbi:MAG: hypothetical protein AB1324_00615 [Candidatus Micrarchaeota archaeon]